ncbi:MAG: hypothetical protein PWQ82_297 [Thermosediminibacterales bacterium]|nr:hypothetical protein [Thermosediminibacterales bacterium]MDK2835822.1 hypothetical protein [Thermosediminibacterales bacterium]
MKFQHGKGILYASTATVFFATSPILTLLIKGISPGGITFMRMFLGAVFVFILAKLKRINLSINKKNIKKFLLYGFIAAMHFLFYIWSLFYTSIAHSLSIVYTAPIFVTLFAWFFLKEPIKVYKFVGIVVVVMGIAILTGFEPEINVKSFIGDFMALISAVCFGLYSVAGRMERENYPLLKYAFWLYLSASAFLFPFALNTIELSAVRSSILPILLLALLPTTLGHTLYNASLRYTHPTYANLISTQEVTGGIILGYFVLGQIPSINSIIGCIIMLIGLAIVLLNNIPIYGNIRSEKEI